MNNLTVELECRFGTRIAVSMDTDISGIATNEEHTRAVDRWSRRVPCPCCGSALTLVEPTK